MPHFPAERRLLEQQITNRLNLLAKTFYRLARPIDGWEFVDTGTGQDIADPPESGWRPFAMGSEWGDTDVTHWFRASTVVPEEMTDAPLYCILDFTGGEGQCYVNGLPVQGLDENRWPVRLGENAVAGKELSIVVEHYAKDGPQRFLSASLAIKDLHAWSLYWDLKTALETAMLHPENTTAYVQILDAVDRATKRIDMRVSDDIKRWDRMVIDSQIRFRSDMEKFPSSVADGKLVLMTHSHIDVAWMWPLRETRRKVGRTFSTVLNLLDEYPEITFLQSQPQLYQYAKDHFPSLYERVKEYVRQGRWVPTGAALIEQDINVPSGEAHTRQYLYGNRFYREEFGIHTNMVWLPDCFGFSFSLPQIMKKAQIDYFATWKPTGNEYNAPQYSFFRWKGLDGTEVPAIIYPQLCSGFPNPGDVKGAWDGFRQKDVSDEFNYVFGHGDGGGGPMPDMIEYVRREKNTVGVPRCEFGNIPEHTEMMWNTVDRDLMPVHHDEIYYEEHRGCQTSQARTKMNNRKSELLARDTEIVSVLAKLRGAEYEHGAINAAWKLILLNQFHDILPGSSIKEVYEDAERDYATAQKSLSEIRARALCALAGSSDAVSVINTLGWNRADAAALPLKSASDVIVVSSSGEEVPSQVIDSNDGSMLLFEVGDVPAFGAARYQVKESVAVASHGETADAPTATENTLENRFFIVEISINGELSRIYDKRACREVLAEGQTGNQLVLFDDRPANYDAWNVDFNINDVNIPVTNVVSIGVTELGPVRASVRVVKITERSTITQDISLWRSIPRIDFVTEVDWREKNRMLKAAFPVNVLSRNATYEIQYGAIERPTHFTTSYDRAKFEVTGHKWIDLSETGYGVSLLNDCKYGFDVHDNVMRISLLRSPTNPDPDCDQGRQVFTYSLYPHKGSWQEAQTVRRGYELNVPPTVLRGDIDEPGLISVDTDHIIIDCLKKAEDSDDVILRLYEAHGQRGPVKLSFSRPIGRLVECDSMEESDTTEGLVVGGHSVSFEVRPFEMKAFKVRM